MWLRIFFAAYLYAYLVMIRSLGSLILVAALASAAAAESGGAISIRTFDPESATEPVAGVEGPGIKIGEGTVLHPVIGIEGGFDSNVFYESTATNAGGILRFLAQIGVGSLSSQRLTPAGDDGGDQNLGFFQYRASLRAAYDWVLSGNNKASDTSGLGIGATGAATVNPMGHLTFNVDDNFMRLIRAANFETGVNTNRDINTFGANLTLHSDSTTLSGMVYYRNTIDVFERSEQSFADRIQHRIGLRPQWRIRPKTLLFADVSQGFYGPLGRDSHKVSSKPFTALAGIGTLFTPRLSLNLQGGYTNGFYSSGPSFSSIELAAQVGFRYATLGRATLAYELHHEDSINANFYRDHTIRLAVQHQFSPVLVMVQPEVHFRRYSGITEVTGPVNRDDVILAVIAGVHYNLRDYLAATLDFRFTDVNTSYRGGGDDPGYARHQVLLGMRWAL